MPNNMVLLETIALTQSAASVTFDNLPTSGYTDLKVVASTRSDVNSVEALVMSINGSTANFTYRFMDGGAGTPRSGTAKVDGIVNGTDYTASTFSSSEIYIPNYRSSNFKSFSVEYVSENNASAGYNGFTAGLWSQTAAITSLSFARATTGNLVAGSTFSLYGIAALGTTPVLAPKATGGNIVANDGTYWYHAFTSSGNFVPQLALTADFLVVAGGGGGGWLGAGGGAGGLVALTSQSLSTTQTVTVGAGGNASTGGVATQGSSSQIGSFTAAVGGGAGQSRGGTGSTGGSGGGGGDYGSANSTGFAGTSGQGFAGGNGYGTNNGSGQGSGSGGGGGAGAAGGVGQTNTGGNGGAGSSAYSTWATATSTGVSGSYAGGGGGSNGQTSGGSGGSASAGGGAGGSNTALGSSATINTGGGGGGGGNASNGGAGASGIVIIRYPIA